VVAPALPFLVIDERDRPYFEGSLRTGAGQGNLPAALASYRTSLDIAERLTPSIRKCRLAGQPTNANRSLSGNSGHSKIRSHDPPRCS
jgi:hypothetical protein